MSGLTQRSAFELQQLIASGELSPVTLMRETLDSIATHNPAINAICTLSETAMAEAEAAAQAVERGDALGPLHGLPVGIKDVTPVANMRTTFGSPLYADHVPDEDALVVTRLRQAGAIVIAKTNTPEFATGGNTFNEVFGRTCNPWNLERSAGGSTGGGAAGLASGMIALAEGTDLGGSLRIPASFCGVVGLRPSPGLVPTYPSDYQWDNMQVSGPMGRTAVDVAMMLQAVAGPSPYSPTAQPVAGRNFIAAAQAGMPAGTRVAYCPDIAGIGVDPEVATLCQQAAFDLQKAGATVTEVAFDLSYARKPFLAIRGMWMIVQQFPRLDRAAEFGPNLAGNVTAGLKVTMAELAEAEHIRGQIWHRFRQFFNEYDYLLTPCMVVPPFPVTQNYPETINGKAMKTYIDWVAPTFLLSLTGLPVASVPCGLTSEGLPVALQIVGPSQGEERVLGMAHQIQQMQPIGLPTY